MVLTFWPLMTPNDLWLPPKTKWITCLIRPPIKNEIPHIYPSWDIYRVYKVFTFWPLVTPNDLWPPHKSIGIIYSIWSTHTTNKREVTLTLLEILCLQTIYKVFTIWPLLISNDLWPPRKTIGIIYAIWPTHTLNLRSLTFTLLRISCLQGFDHLTSRDPKWPLTSTQKQQGASMQYGQPTC